MSWRLTMSSSAARRSAPTRRALCTFDWLICGSRAAGTGFSCRMAGCSAAAASAAGCCAMHAGRAADRCASFRSLEAPRATAGSPVQEHQRAAEHSAEMREMRNTRLRAGNAQDQLDDAIERNEEPRWHGNGREQQDDSLPGEMPCKGEEQPEHPAGCA